MEKKPGLEIDGDSTSSRHCEFYHYLQVSYLSVPFVPLPVNFDAPSPFFMNIKSLFNSFLTFFVLDFFCLKRKVETHFISSSHEG